jgi:hypothetical protein
LHFGRLFGRAQRGTHFLKALGFKESEHNGVAVAFVQAGHRLIQERRDLSSELLKAKAAAKHSA